MPAYSGIKTNWKDWDNYLPNLVCRCAIESDKKGKKLFGLQYYGEQIFHAVYFDTFFDKT